MRTINYINNHLQSITTIMGMFLFVFVFTTLESFFYKSFIEVGLLILISMVVLFLGRVLINSYYITINVIDVMWIMFLVTLVINVLLNNLINVITIYDIFVYTAGVSFLILAKIDINYYKSTFKLIAVLSIFYAAGAMLQYFFADAYFNYIFQLFPDGYQRNILAQYLNGSYSGFTYQVAYTAGYIVSGLGVVILLYWKNRSISRPFLTLVIVLLIFGLLLTTKRAHLIFFILALTTTLVLSMKNKFLLRKIMKIISFIFSVIVGLIIIFNADILKSNEILSNSIEEIIRTFSGIIQGEDISSGRFVLYNYAWSLFQDNSFFGIGWKEFIENSKGLINPDRGSSSQHLFAIDG